MAVWLQSIALAKYLEVAPDMRREEWPTKRVIEVGAGCGLVGIVLGLQGLCSPPPRLVIHRSRSV
jgi:predicted nicotinamide N-methyase